MNALTREYIGTLGCFSSPKLCDKWLNRFTGVKSVLLVYKPLIKFVEETIAREIGELRGNSHV